MVETFGNLGMGWSILHMRWTWIFGISVGAHSCPRSNALDGDCYLPRQRDFAVVIKWRILGWGRLPWTARWAYGITRVLLRGRQEEKIEGWKQRLGRREDGTLLDTGQGIQVPLEAGKGKETTLPWSLQQEGTRPAHTWMWSLPGPLQTSDLCKCVMINEHCIQPLCL